MVRLSGDWGALLDTLWRAAEVDDMACECGWTAVVGALTIPAVALFAAWIARQQWITARNKLRLELFEKRLAVYVATHDFLIGVLKAGGPSDADPMNFEALTYQGKFLFGSPVRDSLRYIEEGLNRLVATRKAFPTLTEESERDANVLAQLAGEAWIRRLLSRELDEAFGQDLTLRD